MSRAFLTKCIDRLQHMALDESEFTNVLHHFVAGNAPVVWDDKRALFWVCHPNDGWQVAVWMMPAAEKFQPTKGDL